MSESSRVSMRRNFAYLATFGNRNFCLSGGGRNLPERQTGWMAANRIKELREHAGMTLEALAEKVKLSVSYVQRLEKGDRNLSLKHLPNFAAALEVKPQDIVSTIDGPLPAAETKGLPRLIRPAGPEASEAAHEVVPGPDLQAITPGPRDVPVLGISVGGLDSSDDGRDPDFWINGEVVNYVARPKGLAHIKNLFSVYVRGDSMWPRYEENDLVFLQEVAPAIGDDVVIELHPKTGAEDHTPTFIKRLVARRGSYIVTRQFNPDKELEFTIKEIRRLFRVIPTKEWVG